MVQAGGNDFELTAQTDQVNENRILDEFVLKNTEYVDRLNKLKLEDERNYAIRHLNSRKNNPLGNAGGENEGIRNPLANLVNPLGLGGPPSVSRAKSSLSRTLAEKKIKKMYAMGLKDPYYKYTKRNTSRLPSQNTGFELNYARAGIRL